MRIVRLRVFEPAELPLYHARDFIEQNRDKIWVAYEEHEDDIYACYLLEDDGYLYQACSTASQDLEDELRSRNIQRPDRNISIKLNNPKRGNRILFFEYFPYCSDITEDTFTITPAKFDERHTRNLRLETDKLPKGLAKRNGWFYVFKEELK